MAMKQDREPGGNRSTERNREPQRERVQGSAEGEPGRENIGSERGQAAPDERPHHRERDHGQLPLPD